MPNLPVAIDVESALHSLSTVSPGKRWPAGAPSRDFLRSPAAARVGQLALADELFLFDFEQRIPLGIPDAWIEEGREEDAMAPQWLDGELPERKYQSFRHDLMIGSFHAGHRGKWTAHELCHALVGFHWRSGATPLRTATAGRLAELLPVVLYYFFDEVRLQRCPDHHGGGPLFRAACPDCERVAAFAEPGPGDREAMENGLRYLDRELAAIARTRRLGRPISHRWGSLDLCSDGLAYARAHGARLNSEAMERWAPFALGNRESLDELEHRVIEVTRGLLLGEPVNPHGATRADWIRADLAFRMLTVWQETDGEAAAAILDLLEDPDPIRWTELTRAFALPSTEQVFTVGYPIPGMPRCANRSIQAGLQSVCPLTLELAEDAGVVLAFDPPPERRGLGHRFCDWLEQAHPMLAPLARLEVVMRSVALDPLGSLGTDGHGLELAAELLRTPYDVVAVSEAVDSGSIAGVVRDGVICLEPAPTPANNLLAVHRSANGELVMVELPATLDLGRSETLDPAVAKELLTLGVLRRTTWKV